MEVSFYLKTKVILIGGPPGAGKTTLGRNLAIKLGWTSLSIDDLCVAVKEVTTPDSHPGLHLMERGKHIDYFTNNSPEILIEDAIDQQNAVWSSLKRVIINHAEFGSPIIIEGSMLHPEKISSLSHEHIKSFWMYVTEEVLLQREKKNSVFFSDSPDPVKMLNNFMARSFWYNAKMNELAKKYEFPVLYQDGTQTVESHLAEISEQIL